MGPLWEQIHKLQKITASFRVRLAKLAVLFGTKGQLISKKIVKPRILPKNERMNSFLLVCDMFSFVFWENPQPEKNVSRLSDL